MKEKQLRLAILSEREATHGNYRDNCRYVEGFMHVLESSPNWATLDSDIKMSMRMFAVKMSRIINGDAEYDDNWRDIAGYANLVLERLTKT